ncbi:DUF1302 family protein [Aquincola sp. MAHUQ-54]|uniref:DUF1302 family protein n=1 Tax=Aquincola agrisoli TaxID=3119538 RepID=A0AAW9QE60_9BURK
MIPVHEMGARARRCAPAVLAMAACQCLAADWSVSGMLREEIAAPVDTRANAASSHGNLFNGVPVANTGLGPVLAPGSSPATLGRPRSLAGKNDLNLLATRVELNLDGKFGERWALHGKLRGFYDAAYGSGVLDGGNAYRQPLRGSGGGTAFEKAGKSYAVDLPALYLDYNDGPLWVRIGNQQIAWGEAIFFRVLDVPNGLDLRRHSILDVAAEEYADKRVSSPAIRASWRAGNDWEVEGFTSRFQPTVLAGADSAYNLIPNQFEVHQREGYGAVRNKWNFGARLKGRIGDTGVQLMATSRINPDGVFRWTDSKAGPMSGTAFEAGSTRGVYSAAEWFRYANLVRLDPVTALQSALNEFPASQGLGSAAVAQGCGGNVSAGNRITFPTAASAACMLDTFFDPSVGAGNLVGHITREYHREQVFGFGLNHVFEGAPDTLLDQLVARFELTHTPRKKFTHPSLSAGLLSKDETQFALIFEKYHKFSAEVPATYMVAQWLHKSASDLFGRSLAGMGRLDPVTGRPKGVGSFNAFALALQQPSPTLAWRGDLTVLTDFRGGWLLQPGVMWKPSKSLQFDLYGNYVRSNGGNDDFAENLKSAREVFVRASFYF